MLTSFIRNVLKDYKLKGVQKLDKRQLQSVKGQGVVHCWRDGEIVWSAVSSNVFGDFQATRLCYAGGGNTQGPSTISD